LDERSKRIEALEDGIDLVIEELSARDQGQELVGGETLIQFLTRLLEESVNERKTTMSIKKAAGFEYEDDTVFKMVSKADVEKIAALKKDVRDTRHESLQDEIHKYLEKLPFAKISAHSETIGILNMREPDFEWFLEKWNES
jgi:hypothetical protein